MDLDGDFPSPEGEQQTDESIFSNENDTSSMSAFADPNPNPMGPSTIGSTSASSGMGQPSLDMLTPQTTQSLFHNLGQSRLYHNCNN